MTAQMKIVFLIAFSQFITLTFTKKTDFMGPRW